MKKLLAIISSSAVCVSAVAVSVLSYFPTAKVGADASYTSSLVATDLTTSPKYPVITFTKDELVNATNDLYTHVYFCPTGWSGTSRVSPASFGEYSSTNGFYQFVFWYAPSTKKFSLSCNLHFGSNLAGKKLFAYLFLSTRNGIAGVPAQDIWLTSSCSYNETFDSIVYSYKGSSFDPTALLADPVFSLSGWIGNDYELWLSSQGYSEGYDSGYSDGRTIGHDEGYGVGFNAGKSVGYSNGYSDGIPVGYSNGLNDGSSNFGMWDLFSNAFGSVGNILGIQLFPGLSIGLLISVPIAFAFILWLIHVLKG